MEFLMTNDTYTKYLFNATLGKKLSYEIFSIFTVSNFVKPHNFSSFEKLLLILEHVTNEI